MPVLNNKILLFIWRAFSFDQSPLYCLNCAFGSAAVVKKFVGGCHVGRSRWSSHSYYMTVAISWSARHSTAISATSSCWARRPWASMLLFCCFESIIDWNCSYYNSFLCLIGQHPDCSFFGAVCLEFWILIVVNMLNLVRVSHLPKGH